MNILQLLIVVFLVMFSGLFSGLTLGLMSLNQYTLRRKMRLGNKRAAVLYPIRKQGNLLLCTLLLGNVLVNSILSVFLGSLTVGVVAVVASTGLIVIFGEIIPQAAISRYALRFGARTAWITKIFIVLLYPITKPIAMGLDKLLGHELPITYSKKELALILKDQRRLKGSDVDKDDAALASKSLTFSDTSVKDVMTPLDHVFVAEESQTLNESFLKEVHKQGHSRIPVMKKGKVVGILYAKDLVALAPSKQRKVRDVMRKRVRYVEPQIKLDDALELFQKERLHLFIVRKGTILGIITLEDTLEEITGEIIDEHDRFKDMRTLEGKR